MKESLMSKFEMDLVYAEELPTTDSPWYIIAGGKAILLIMSEPEQEF